MSKKRLIARSTTTDDGCLVWTGPKDACGYGKIRIGSRTDNTRRTVGTHRLAWIEHFGPIPKGMCVCHKCDVRSCINPDHLFLGTHDENMKDAVRKGKFIARPTQITDDLCHRAIQLAEKMTRRAVAKETGISPTMVTMLVNRKTRVATLATRSKAQA